MKDFKELSFSEYYNSKKQLTEALDESPRLYSCYKLKKYCKVPVAENYDDEKFYVSLKPYDKIQILWEYENLHFPIAKNFVIVNENNKHTYYPCWNNEKLLKWVINNTDEINDGSILYSD